MKIGKAERVISTHQKNLIDGEPSTAPIPALERHDRAREQTCALYAGRLAPDTHVGRKLERGTSATAKCARGLDEK